MKKVLLTAVLLAIPFTTINAASYKIDPTHTYAHFKISHLGFSTMHGRFDKSSGMLTMDQAAKKGSVDISIEAASVNTALKKRDDHLRSGDFLNAAEFPTITYKSTAVSFTSASTAKVSGNLTIMGVSKPVKLDVTHIKCGTHPFNKKTVCGFDATASIKRSDFGVKYGLPAIGDEMQITLEVEAVKQ